jgi:hypothetical protein
MPFCAEAEELSMTTASSPPVGTGPEDGGGAFVD